MMLEDLTSFAFSPWILPEMVSFFVEDAAGAVEVDAIEDDCI